MTAKLPIPTEKIHISLPEDLRRRLELDLWSDLEGRVPKGAYKRFFTTLLGDYYARKDSLARQGNSQ
jgi:hypothetical protein